MAKAAELDKNLVDGLKAARSKRAYFALVLKGSNDGALILAKTKVPPAEIATAKKQSGGSAILKGFCQYEEGRYLFDTAKEAPATAAQAVKIIVKRDAGMTIIAEFRISTDPELLADEADAAHSHPPASPPAPAAAATPASQDGAEVAERFKAMTPEIKTALAGPNQAPVKALFGAISGQIKSKDFAAATKGLDELEALVKPAPAAAAAPAPQDGAAVADRLKALTPDIKTALAGPNQAQVKALFVAVSGQIKNKDFVQASKVLDEIEPLLKPAAAAPSAPDLAAEWKTKLAEWTPAIKAALTAKGPNAAAIGKLLAQASALSKPGGDMAQAIAKLTDCHALTISAAEPAAKQDAPESAAKSAPAAEPLAPDKLRSFVRTMTASRDWSEARKAAASDLNTLSSVILAEYDGDPRIGEVKQFLDKAATGLGVLDDPKLDDLVLQLADSSDEKRPAIQSEAAKIVKRLQGVLDQQNNLAALEDWPTMSLPLHSRLSKSLTALEAQLAG